MVTVWLLIVMGWSSSTSGALTVPRQFASEAECTAYFQSIKEAGSTRYLRDWARGLCLPVEASAP